MENERTYDEIGPWSEVKLDIVREYASAYSRILSKKGFHHIYIDAFAGAGVHISRGSGEYVLGSPLNALNVDPPFKEYHLIDLQEDKVASLRAEVGERKDVFIYQGDCNELLLESVFPRAQFKDYRRALCLLDPYGLHLNWEVVKAAGSMRSVEIFLNFPIVGMNRGVLWRDRAKVEQSQLDRMNAYWGDDSWQAIAYTGEDDLFGHESKVSNERIAVAFQRRLKEVAGFENVPEPMPVRNTKGSTLYYLFFASQKPVAEKIVRSIFDKFRSRGEL